MRRAELNLLGRFHFECRGPDRRRVHRRAAQVPSFFSASGRSVVLRGCALLALAGEASFATERDPGELRMAATDRSIWVWERDRSSADALTRFVHCETGGAAVSVCRPGPAVLGRVGHLCVVGTDAMVFFKDGTVRRFPVPRPLANEGVSATSTLEPSLPDPWFPALVASDARSERVFALTPVEVARKLVDRRAKVTQGGGNDDEPLRFGQPREGDRTPVADRAASGGRARSGEIDERARDGAGLPPQALFPPDDSLVVIRFERGLWSFDRAAPVGLRETDAVVAFWATAEGPRLWCRSAEGVSNGRVYRAAGSDAGWHSSAPPPIPADAVSVAAGFDEPSNADVLACVERDATNGEQAFGVRVWRSAGEDWDPGVSLSDSSGAPATWSTAPVISVAGRTVLTTPADGQGATDGPATRSVAVWSSVDGVQTSSIGVEKAFDSSREPRMHPIARHALPYTALAVVLSLAFVRRRERLTSPVVLQAGQSPARLERRFGAFVVDSLVLLPVSAPTMTWLWRSSVEGVVSWEELLRASEAANSPLFWAGVLFGAEFAAYATVFEWLMGATPGKRIFRCRVVGDGGAPCALSGILMRNVVRVVEFHFTASLLIVLLTPGRQRLGDLLAATLVVEEHVVDAFPSDGENGTQS